MSDDSHPFEPSEYLIGGCAVCGDRIAPTDHEKDKIELTSEAKGTHEPKRRP